MNKKTDNIIIKGAKVNNLKNIDIDIPKNKLVVITGVSGSGKSSLAFDTVYMEGQRRYVESLSSYARQFIGGQEKPNVDHMTGLSPAIAIDQKSGSYNPRSTVATITETHDLLRLLFTHLGKTICPNCHLAIKKQTKTQILENILGLKLKNLVKVLSPVIENKKIDYEKILDQIVKTGFKEVRVDSKFYLASEINNIKLDNNQPHTIEIVVAEIQKFEKILKAGQEKNEMLKAFNSALDLSNGVIVFYDVTKNKDYTFSENLSCPKCNFNLPDLEPRLFSFNSPVGACSTCTGLGEVQKIIPELLIPNKKLTIAQGAIRPLVKMSGRGNSKLVVELEKISEQCGFSINTPIKDLTAKQLDIIYNGQGNFEGVIPNLMKKYQGTDSDFTRSEIEKYMRKSVCPDCQGKRLNQVALSITVGNKNIAEMEDLAIQDMLLFFNKLKLEVVENQIAQPILKEISERLESLIDVGLGYLSLSRSSQTLSGGELQRIKLASQINTNLSGVIYVLDEPSIGLHQKDNDKLIDTLKKLRDLGNTVIVVEHDQETMQQADWIIDVGPGAGKYGGEIVAQGTPAEIKKNKKSLTGQYLSGAEKVALKNTKKGKAKKFITIKKASAFNLKNIDVKIPLGKLVCITGVSGSGKSTLMTEILGKALANHFYQAKDLPGQHQKILGLNNIDKVISIDQSPIGRTPRSNPATYTNVFTSIRELFAQTKEAQLKRFDAGHFSFNVQSGRCETCQGGGKIKIEMNFLPDIYVPCPDCQGNRFKPEILEIHYQEKNISNVLNMTVEEATEFFKHVPIIHHKLNILTQVGLEYIQLGQPATTLSGGEAQRVKLATELSRRDTGKTLYILDEPTTGLHFEDIKKLLKVLNQLVAKGNTVLVIEHNLDVIKNADWIVDLGPEGGDAGGYLVAEGTPQDVAKNKKSYTGQYLKKVLN